MSIFNHKDKNSNFYIDLTHLEGIESFSKDTVVCLKLHENKLEIKRSFSTKPSAFLNYSQITNAAVVREQEIIEIDKSVVGRAIVGGLLLGTLGAEIGGISGVGKKKKTKYSCYLIINYIPSTSEETKVLVFDVDPPPTLKHLQMFEAELRKRAGLSELGKEEKSKLEDEEEIQL